jgi:putative membrane-bound dehydrogenase-like protein
MRKLVYLLFLLMLGAEPAVDSKDLPRIPPVEPADAIKTFQIKEGFKIELAAAEPLVVDPVAMAFDEDGRLFVVEMRDYSERRDEKLGRIRMLTDADGDGKFDKSTIYADNLPWPTAIICWDGGVFVGASPDIWFMRDKDGDGVADEKKVVITGFGSEVTRLNVQQLLNSFTWGLDNRIHGASGGNGGVIFSRPQLRKDVDVRGKDFSFDPRTLEIRAESGGGQHGLSFDDTGRKFVCSNSHHIQSVMYELRYSARNPNFAMPSALIDIATDGPAAEVYRISPEEPWRVIRTKWRVSGLVPGPIEGGGRSAGYFTGATGVTIFRGGAWGKEYIGDAFIGDAGGNLVHRKKITANGTTLTAARPADEQKREFLASKDTWFRPVQFANGPDGNLYICDMYRETIEHPWSLPESIKKHLDLNSGNDRGRIYRIVKEGAKYRPPVKMSKLTAPELVPFLESSNGWTRDTAARLLYERQDSTAIEPLKRLAKQSPSPLGRMHALHALGGMKELNANIIGDALEDKDPVVRRHAVVLSERAASQPQVVSIVLPNLVRLVDDPDILVRYQLAFTLGEFDKPDCAEILAMLAKHNAADRWISAAIFTSPGNRTTELYRILAADKQFASTAAEREFLHQLVIQIAASADSDQIKLLLREAMPKGASPSFALLRALGEGLQRRNKKLADFAEFQSIVADTSKFYPSSPIADDSTLIETIELLGFGNDKHSEIWLYRVLALKDSSSAKSAAVAALDRRSADGLARELIERWPSLTPRVRSTALNVLLKRTDRCELLLGALETGIIRPSELDPTQINFLRRYPNQFIAESANKILQNSDRPRQEVINTFMPALEAKADPANGKKLFLDRCASCHRIEKDGFALGPDLVTVKNSGKEKLLVNILDPNREVASQYSAYLVETKDGDSILGIIVNDTATSITLRQAYGQETVIFRNNIKKLKNQGQSLMPEGLEEGLKAQDLADLLEFISK